MPFGVAAVLWAVEALLPCNIQLCAPVAQQRTAAVSVWILPASACHPSAEPNIRGRNSVRGLVKPTLFENRLQPMRSEIPIVDIEVGLGRARQPNASTAVA